MSDAKVCIVDDHRLVAETLKLALEACAVATRIIEPAPCDVVMTALLSECPDLVLLDLDLRERCDSRSLLGALVNRHIPVLVITGSTDRLWIASALEQGAVAYQPKAAGFDALLQAVAHVLRTGADPHPGERSQLLSELAVARAAHDRTHAAFRRLTDRERETLHAIGNGRSAKQIADEWLVSEATVRSHIRGLLCKVGVNSQREAVALAVRSGWFMPAATRSRALS